jgi:hypothetical protein
MTTDAPLADTGPEPAGRRHPLSGRQLATRIVLGVTVLAIVAMWIYAFIFASDDAVAKVSDREWAARADEICARRNDLLDKNAAEARAGSDGSPQALGAAVAKATDIIEAALDEVQATLPNDATDRELIAEWDRLYRTYIADRRAAEAKMAAGENSELNESMVNGSPISESINDFTKVNRMNECAAPAGR